MLLAQATRAVEHSGLPELRVGLRPARAVQGLTDRGLEAAVDQHVGGVRRCADAGGQHGEPGGDQHGSEDGTEPRAQPGHRRSRPPPGPRGERVRALPRSGRSRPCAHGPRPGSAGQPLLGWHAEVRRRATRRPSGVTRSARVRPTRRTQSRSRQRSATAAPTPPARCGRRSVQSTQTSKVGRRCRSTVSTSTPQAVRPVRPSSVRAVPESSSQPREAIGVVHGDAEAAGEVVVARPCRPYPPLLGRQPVRRHLGHRLVPAEQLQGGGDRGVGDPHAAVPAVPPHRDQSGLGEDAQVLARRARRQPDRGGELTRRVLTPVEQDVDHPGASRRGERRADAVQVHGGHHPSMAPRRLGRRRDVRLLASAP